MVTDYRLLEAPSHVFVEQAQAAALVDLYTSLNTLGYELCKRSGAVKDLGLNFFFPQSTDPQMRTKIILL